MEAVPVSSDSSSSGGVPPAQFRWVMSHFCSGIVVVTAVHRQTPVGLTCQSFAALSMQPPLVMLGMSRQSRSWPEIRAAGRFAVNILGEQQEQVSRRFATSGADKFTGTGWHRGGHGAPLLDGALAYVECSLVAVHPGGDHDIAVGRVLDLRPGSGRAGPLLYFRSRYHALPAVSSPA